MRTLLITACLLVAFACSKPTTPPPEAPCKGVDLETDVANCGACGNVCPAPANADVRCVAGACSRGTCKAGMFDLGGGCVWTCSGTTCTNGNSGEVVTVTVLPLAETGITHYAFSTGSAQGGYLQTSTSFSNFSVVGESTPPAPNGAVKTSGDLHSNYGGFSISLQQGASR